MLFHDRNEKGVLVENVTLDGAQTSSSDVATLFASISRNDSKALDKEDWKKHVNWRWTIGCRETISEIEVLNLKKEVPEF